MSINPNNVIPNLNVLSELTAPQKLKTTGYKLSSETRTGLVSRIKSFFANLVARLTPSFLEPTTRSFSKISNVVKLTIDESLKQNPIDFPLIKSALIGLNTLSQSYEKQPKKLETLNQLKAKLEISLLINGKNNLKERFELNEKIIQFIDALDERNIQLLLADPEGQKLVNNLVVSDKENIWILETALKTLQVKLDQLTALRDADALLPKNAGFSKEQKSVLELVISNPVNCQLFKECINNVKTLRAENLKKLKDNEELTSENNEKVMNSLIGFSLEATNYLNELNYDKATTNQVNFICFRLQEQCMPGNSQINQDTFITALPLTRKEKKETHLVRIKNASDWRGYMNPLKSGFKLKAEWRNINRGDNNTFVSGDRVIKFKSPDGKIEQISVRLDFSTFNENLKTQNLPKLTRDELLEIFSKFKHTDDFLKAVNNLDLSEELKGQLINLRNEFEKQMERELMRATMTFGVREDETTPAR